MYKLFIVLLLALSFSMPSFGTEPVHGSGNAGNVGNSANFNKNLAMVGAGAFGLVLASGAVGLFSATSMMVEGSAFADAMESGAGLSLPVTLLSAVLGAVFGQDLVLRNIQNFRASELTH